MASILLTNQTNPTTTTTGITHLETSRSILHWNIQNVNRILPNEAEVGLAKSDTESYYSEFKPLKSPVFTTTFGQTGEIESKQKWFVDLNVNNLKPENNGTILVEGGRYISLFLWFQPMEKLHHSQLKPVRLYVTFSIIGKDEKAVLERSTETLFENVEKIDWGFPRFIKLSQLWGNGGKFILDNVLRIKVDLMVYGSPLTEKMGLGVQKSLSLATNKFVDDMRHLLKSGRDADVTIQCNGKDFLVHSPILKERCFVFNRMLESDMMESKDRVINIDDVDPDVFEAFLEFIYSGHVELLPESMDKLMGLVRVADKYGVEELKTICFKYIAENISLETAGEIAVLAFQHNAEDKIRFKIISFCQTNWPALWKHSPFKARVSDHPLAFFYETTKKQRLGD